MQFINRVRTYWLLVVALFGGVIYFQACKYDKSLESYIPLDAGVVMVVHASDIATKLLFEKIGDVDISTLLEVINNLDIYPSSSEEAGAIFEQPTALGIDLLSDFYFYVGNDRDKKEQYAGILFKMRDAKKFRKALKNNFGDSLEVNFSQKEGLRSALFPTKKIAIGWNNDIACLLLSRNAASFPHIETHLEKMFNLRQNECIMQDTNFVSMLEVEADVSVYLHPENVKATADFVPTAYLNNDVEYLNAFVSFEKGKLHIAVKQYLSSDNMSFYQNILDTNEHIDLFRRVDEEEIVAFLNFQYNRGIIPKIIDAYKLQMTLKAVLLTLNIDEEELYQLTEGDMMVIFLGEIESMQEVVSYEYDENFNKTEVVEMKNVKAPGFVAEVIVGEKMASLLAEMKRQGLMKEDSGIYNLGEITGFDTYFALNQDRLVVTTDARFLQKVKRRLLDTPTSPLQVLGTEYPIAGYLDIHQLENKFPHYRLKYITGAELAALSKTVSNLSFHVAPLHDNVIESDFEVVFTNKEKSSLAGAASLIEFLKIISNKEQSTQ